MTATISVLPCRAATRVLWCVRSIRDGDFDVGADAPLAVPAIGLHAVDGFDDVGAGLAEDDDQDGRLAVGQAEVAQILHVILDVGDVRQAHRRAVAIGDDQRRVVRCVVAWSLV